MRRGLVFLSMFVILSLLVVLLAVLAGQHVQKNLRPIPVRTREQQEKEGRSQYRR